MNAVLSAALVSDIAAVAKRAGEAVLQIYRSQQTGTRFKEDASPVTDADLLSQKIICAALLALTPGIPVIAEEDDSSACRTTPPRFWLVDPLDGTREFIARNGEFTVNIALVEKAQVTLGVVLAPALGLLFTGAAGQPAYMEQAGARRAIRCRPEPDDGLVVVASRSHGDPDALQALLGGRRVASIRNAGSSLKLCLVATGEADLYPRLGRTMEWDTAAGHAVLLSAGGSLADLSGRPMTYGKPGFCNPHFVARGAG